MPLLPQIELLFQAIPVQFSLRGSVRHIIVRSCSQHTSHVVFIFQFDLLPMYVENDVSTDFYSFHLQVIDRLQTPRTRTQLHVTHTLPQLVCGFLYISGDDFTSLVNEIIPSFNLSRRRENLPPPVPLLTRHPVSSDYQASARQPQPVSPACPGDDPA